MNRREILAGIGLGFTPVLAGCSEDTAGSDDPSPSDGSESGGDAGDGTDDGETDADDHSIDGRLHNETDTAHTFELVVRDSDGDVLTEGEERVEASTTERVPAVARPGEPRTFDVAVDGVETSRTLEFDVEPTAGQVDGYVDIRYTGGKIVIFFTDPDGTDDGAADADRVDTPPYEIQKPDDVEDWNEEYLGEHMPTEPSLGFEVLTNARGVLRERRLTHDADEEYWVGLATDGTARDELLDLDAVDAGTRERIESVDFEERLLVVVETGYGSGSVEHRWGRMEDTADGVDLYGYYTDPTEGTDDVTTWLSLLEIERPDTAVDRARVSLTVDTDRRVRFDSTEGVVTLEG